MALGRRLDFSEVFSNLHDSGIPWWCEETSAQTGRKGDQGMGCFKEGLRGLARARCPLLGATLGCLRLPGSGRPTSAPGQGTSIPTEPTQHPQKAGTCSR